MSYVLNLFQFEFFNLFLILLLWDLSQSLLLFCVFEKRADYKVVISQNHVSWMIEVLAAIKLMVDGKGTLRCALRHSVFEEDLYVGLLPLFLQCYLGNLDLLPFSLFIYLEMLFDDFILIELETLILHSMVHDLQLIECILSPLIVDETILQVLDGLGLDGANFFNFIS